MRAVAVVIMTMLAAPVAIAQTPLDPLYGCVRETDPAKRLACFDAAVAALQAAEADGRFTVVDPVRVEALKRDSFGFALPSLAAITAPPARPLSEAPAPAKAVEVTEMVMTIARVTGKDRPLYEMENGQAWRQTEARPARFAKVGATVIVEKGVIGGFLMYAKGQGQGVRVRREK